MLRFRSLAVAALMSVGATFPLQAQASAASAGPRVSATATAVHNNTLSTDDVRTPAAHKNLGQPIALMVVGGAGILLGLIVGGGAGTVIAVAGIVALLAGLYQYIE